MGCSPPRIYGHGLTAAHWLPQRVVGYRPTSSIFRPAGGIQSPYPVSFTKKLEVGRYELAARSPDTLGGLVLGEALSRRSHYFDTEIGVTSFESAVGDGAQAFFSELVNCAAGAGGGTSASVLGAGGGSDRPCTTTPHISVLFPGWF